MWFPLDACRQQRSMFVATVNHSTAMSKLIAFDSMVSN